MAKSLDDVLDSLLDSFGKLPGVIGRIGDAAERMVSGFKPVISALNDLQFSNNTAAVRDAAKVADTGQKMLVTALERQTVATYRLLAATDRLIAVLTRTAVPSLPQGTPTGGGGGGEAGAASGAGGLGRLAAVGAVAAAAFAAVAIAAGLMEREFNRLQATVKLFNPGVIEIFQREMNNLGATIGRAFVPVFQNAIEVVRQMGGILRPIMTSLEPIIRQISDVLANVFLALFRQFASILQASLPAIRIFGELLGLMGQVVASMSAAFAPVIRGLLLFGRLLFELSGLGTILRILTKLLEGFAVVMQVMDAAFTILEAVVNTLVESMNALIQPFIPLRSILDQLTKAVQYVVRNLYVLAVSLARLAGFNDVADAIVESVAKLANQKGDTAAQTPQIKSLEQVTKDLALASAAATAAGGPNGVKNQNEFWTKTLEDLKAARANGANIFGVLIDIKNALLRLAPPGVGAGGAAMPPGGPAAPGAGGLGDGAVNIMRRMMPFLPGGPAANLIPKIAGM